VGGSLVTRDRVEKEIQLGKLGKDGKLGIGVDREMELGKLGKDVKLETGYSKKDMTGRRTVSYNFKRGKSGI
jgi:hypothetical protein